MLVKGGPGNIYQWDESLEIHTSFQVEKVFIKLSMVAFAQINSNRWSIIKRCLFETTGLAIHRRKCSDFLYLQICFYYMMTSLNWYIFHVPGPLWGESTGHQWIPLKRPVTRNWANNVYTRELKRHCAHYDITVMSWTKIFEFLTLF